MQRTGGSCSAQRIEITVDIDYESPGEATDGFCGGAFAGLDKVILDRSEKSSIGFGATVKSKESEKAVGDTLKSVETEDLVKYGLIPEFVGRLPVVATLNELDEAALMQIL